MWSQKEYNDKLISCRLDYRQFDDMQHQSLSGKIVFDKLTRYFKMLFDFKAICTKLSEFSYAKNVELNVMVKEMVGLYLSTIDQWKLVDNYGKIKYKLQQ